MTPNFKPLLSGGVPQAVSAGSGSKPGHQFAPLALESVVSVTRPLRSSGRSEKVDTSELNASTTSNQGGHSKEQGHKAAEIKTLRSGDRVTHIEVTCGCGEIITLECEYTN